jgi:hypothetical protein
MLQEQMSQCAASMKRAWVLPWLGVCHLGDQWLTFRKRRARLRREAITRRRFHRSMAERRREAK